MSAATINGLSTPPSSQSNSLQAELAGWRCQFVADTPVGWERLKQLFGRCRVEATPASASSIHVSLSDGEFPRIRATHDGRICNLAEMLTSGPEWKRLVPLPHPSRQLVRDELLGDAATLELFDGELRVLQPEHWPLYAQLVFLWLVLRNGSVASLHAAACAIDGQAILLVGPSGSGKSTLSWALHQQGADYFGDELALFTLPDYHLSILSRALYLRPGGIETLATPPDTRSWFENKPGDPKCAVPLPAPQQPCPQEHATLFFVDGFAAQSEIRPLPGGDAVRRILSGMGYGDPSLGVRLEVAAGLVNRYPCWALTVGKPEETAAGVIAHLRRQM